MLGGCTNASALTGHFVDHYQNANETADAPTDLSTTTFTAYFPTGKFQVSGKADGTFEIDGVPDGPFVLKREHPSFAPVWTFHEDHDITGTFSIAGRVDAVAPTQPTSLALSIGSMTPYKTGDTLVLACPENGALAMRIPWEDTPGDAALTAMFNWTQEATYYPNYTGFLMNPARGDTLLVLHQSTTTIGVGPSAVTTTNVLDALRMPGPMQADGTTASVTGQFSPMAATDTLDATIDLDALRSLIAQSYSSVLNSGWTAGVDAVPAAAADSGYVIDLVYRRATAPTTTVHETIPFANPIGPDFTVERYAAFQFGIDPGGGIPQAFGNLSISSSTNNIALHAPAWLPSRTSLTRTADGITIALVDPPDEVVGFSVGILAPHQGFGSMVAQVYAETNQVTLPADALPAGDYSLAVQVTFADGTTTLVPTLYQHLD